MQDVKKSGGVYADALRDFLKKERKKVGGTKAFYALLYSIEPSVSEEKRLNNLINRGSLSADFLGLCIDRLNLADVTFGVAFGISLESSHTPD